MYNYLAAVVGKHLGPPGGKRPVVVGPPGGKRLVVVGPLGGKRLVVVGPLGGKRPVVDQHSRQEAQPQPGGLVDQGREQQLAVRVARQGIVLVVEVG